MSTPPPETAPPPAPAAGDQGWARLDWRTLLIDPLKTIRSFIVPAVIALVGVSNSGIGFRPWLVPIIVIGPALLGTLPWLTTAYRVTPTQLQVRRGVLNKQTSTAPLDRIRSVDLEASLVHRVLGVTRVKVGTGVDDDRIELDALAAPVAARLRADLLARRGPAAPAPEAPEALPTFEGGDPDGATTAAPPAPAPADDVVPAEQVLARIDWSWLRFAPFSLTRLVIVAGALGALSQVADDLPIFDGEHLSALWRWVTGFAVPLVVAVLAVGAFVAWLVISIGGYVLQWWGLRLVRTAGTLHLTSGLLTTRSITVEEARVRGVRLSEPWLLRRVGGAELATLATGVEDGVTTILPPSPVAVDRRVGEDVLDAAGPDGPLSVALVAHGRAARRRSHLRVQRVVLVLVALSLLPVVLADWLPWWVPLALLWALAWIGFYVGETSYRHLGHALTERHLVAGAASVARVREVLERDGVIGWTLHETWWQRRAGLTDLRATTAAGSESLLLRDVPRADAVRLAAAVSPDALRRWVA